jgi:hypothetical protein
LPEDRPWTLRDVTYEVIETGEEAITQAKKEKQKQLERAATALEHAIRKRQGENKLLLKSEAEKLLMAEDLSQLEARALIRDKSGIRWIQEKQPGGRGKGKPTALFLLRGEEDRYISTTNKQNNKIKK